MAITDQISQLVTPAVEAQGLFLEEVQLVSPGKHRIVTCIVDGPASLNLDQVTAVSRAISELLDEAAFMGDAPFTLEVTSPGVDRPLTAPRHFVKNHGRLLKVVKNDGATITGRIEESSETSVTLSYLEKKEEKRTEVALADIKRATVEIEFNRKAGEVLRERLATTTVIIVSHQAQVLEKFARSAAVLMGGKLYMFDTLEEAKELYDYETQG